MDYITPSQLDEEEGGSFTVAGVVDGRKEGFVYLKQAWLLVVYHIRAVYSIEAKGRQLGG